MAGRQDLNPAIGSPASGMLSNAALMRALGNQLSSLTDLQIQGASAISGPSGQRIALPPTARLQLFEIQGSDPADTEADVWSTAALPDSLGYGGYNPPKASYWWWTQVKPVLYWPEDTDPGWHVDTNSDPETSGTSGSRNYSNRVLWAPCQSGRSARNLLPSSDGFSSGDSPSYGAGTWVWAIADISSGRWIMVAPNHGIIRAKLLEPLYPCDSARAVVMLPDAPDSGSSGADVCSEKHEITVYDNIGVTGVFFSGGYAPAGYIAIARHFEDTAQFEAISFGDGTCCPGSSSGSSSEPSSSEPSSSEPSSSEPSSSEPSSSEPSISGSSGSGSDSQDSGGSSGDSGGSDGSGGSSGGGGGGSSKSAAIVPASWTPGGYVALYVEEAPQVRFNDVLTAGVVEKETLIPIDPHYIEVCEPGSLLVDGCVPDEPVAIGAKVVGENVRIRLSRKPKKPIGVVIRLTGIRKGFRGLRFTPKTKAQFVANEAVIRKAYANG